MKKRRVLRILLATARAGGGRWCHYQDTGRGAGIGVRGWRWHPELSLGQVVFEVLVDVQWQKKRTAMKDCHIYGSIMLRLNS